MRIEIREFETHTIRFIHGDCMDWMKDCPKYSLSICDPPYGLGDKIALGGGLLSDIKTEGKSIEWDFIPCDQYFKKLFMVSENQLIWGGNYFNLPPTRGFAIWDKYQDHCNNFSATEFCWSSFDCPSRLFRKRYAGFLKKDTIHPTQKPIELYEWLLITYAKEGDKVLDTHGGSMSHAIAAHNLKFSLDIIELDEEYFNTGVKRFDQVTAQKTLF